MQLLHQNQTLLMTVKDINMSANISVKDAPSVNIEVKEKISSNASLRLMNPVASGDNVTTGLNSTHRLKEEMPPPPPLVPCCEGRELQINEDLVRSGLSAISVKHDSVIQCLSMSRACEEMQVPPGLVKHRNSFRCLHRPDLKRVPYLRRMTPDELQILFRGYAHLPSQEKPIKEKNQELLKVNIPPDENGNGKDIKCKVVRIADEGATCLHPILEARPAAAPDRDVPAGMRLHGARARLYTSVLAGAKAGDQLDGISTNEELDAQVVEDTVPDDEVQLNEELQIILPPRYDDVTAESSITTTSTENDTT